MSEPVLANIPNGEANELETLRRVNAELVAKHAKDKAKLEALQAETLSLQAKLTEAGNTIKDATVSVPLKAMADSISKCPELFLEQFSKHYKVEMLDGKLSLLSANGKPVTDKEGNQVPFEAKALVELLTAGDDAAANVFKTITIVSRASGASASISQAKADKAPRIQFGLR